MTRFRYDVVAAQRSRRDGAAVADVRTLALERVLRRRRPRRPRRRTARPAGDRACATSGWSREAALVRLLADGAGSTAHGRRRPQRRSAPSPRGDHPDDLDDIDDRYDVAATWSAGRPRPVRPRAALADGRWRLPAPVPSTPRLPWTAYTNQPARRDAKTLAPDLRAQPARDAARPHGADGVRACSTPCPARPTARSTATRCRHPTAAASRTPSELVAPTGDIEVTIADGVAGHPRRSTPSAWRPTCSTSAPTR